MKRHQNSWLQQFHFLTILTVGIASCLGWPGWGCITWGGLAPGSEPSARKARPHSLPSLREASPGMLTGPLNSTNSRLWCPCFQNSAVSHWPMQVTWKPSLKGERSDLTSREQEWASHNANRCAYRIGACCGCFLQSTTSFPDKSFWFY